MIPNDEIFIDTNMDTFIVAGHETNINNNLYEKYVEIFICCIQYINTIFFLLCLLMLILLFIFSG